MYVNQIMHFTLYREVTLPCSYRSTCYHLNGRVAARGLIIVSNFGWIVFLVREYHSQCLRFIVRPFFMSFS